MFTDGHVKQSHIIPFTEVSSAEQEEQKKISAPPVPQSVSLVSESEQYIRTTIAFIL
jgi:hypothetical protein